ncbi:MAG: cupin domain-containing protein [Boseongicola sp.]|nr:MAG: cupin domain-containing protein [Boseongicola sp.]
MTAPAQNLFAALPVDLAEEEFTDLLWRPGVRIERIVSRGQVTPEGEWYDQDQGEWVMVVQGAARLLIDGEKAERVLGSGDHLYLAPHVRHRVTWTDPDQTTIWLAVFLDDDGAGQA